MNSDCFLSNISVDQAVCKMLRGEQCRLALKGAALQGLEKFSIPMDGSVQYEITLNKFERVRKRNRIIVIYIFHLVRRGTGLK